MDKAVGLAAKLLEEQTQKLTSLTIVPGSGGVFDVEAGGRLLFSKKKSGRFPTYEEVAKAIG
ncbi:MAG TPA: Rdx family protein [Actinomycetota bacterium]|nr:Rdx family protein [Actinomycetota bacterium]